LYAYLCVTQFPSVNNTREIGIFEVVSDPSEAAKQTEIGGQKSDVRGRTSELARLEDQLFGFGATFLGWLFWQIQHSECCLKRLACTAASYRKLVCA
jgi:hypothetical protein